MTIRTLKKGGLASSAFIFVDIIYCLFNSHHDEHQSFFKNYIKINSKI